MEMPEIKSDQFIKIQKYTLFFAGAWPFDFTQNKLISLGYEAYKNIMLVANGMFFISLIIELAVLIAEQKQSARILASLNVLITVVQDRVKLIIYQVKQIPQMCHYVSKYEEEVSTSSDPEIQDYFKQQVNYCRKVNILQLSITLTACIFYINVAIFKVLAVEDLSELEDQAVMQDMWLPFKRESHMNVVFLFGCFALFQSFIYNTGAQTTFVGLMIFASTRLRILQMRLKKFDVIARKDYNDDVMLTIKKLINEHQFLIRFVSSLNNGTKYVLLMEFLLSSLNVASVTVQLLTARSISQALSVMSITFIIILQIFILSWSANEIQVESLGISTAILESNWAEQPESIKKLLLFMIMKTQSPLGLTAGPFFQVSTETALMVDFAKIPIAHGSMIKINLMAVPVVKTFKVAYTYLSVMMQNC